MRLGHNLMLNLLFSSQRPSSTAGYHTPFHVLCPNNVLNIFIIYSTYRCGIKDHKMFILTIVILKAMVPSFPAGNNISAARISSTGVGGCTSRRMNRCCRKIRVFSRRNEMKQWNCISSMMIFSFNWRNCMHHYDVLFWCSLPAIKVLQ